jgi:muramoyltetrapeptide carboxypeptidase
MIIPPFLAPGDKVAIVATARRVTPQEMANALEILDSKGLVVEMDPVIFHNDYYLAGTDELRLQQMQAALDRADIRAIFCARGGYGTTRILDQLDFTAFLQSPKWICGFSDITSLHLRLQQLGVCSVHSTMPLLMGRPGYGPGDTALLDILEGKPWQLESGPDPANLSGEAVGMLAGGNLSLICESLGTPTEIDTHGKILLIEEVDEYRYKVDRMLNQLKRAEKLAGVVGVAVGFMTGINDTQEPFGYDYRAIVRRYTSDLGIPVAFGFQVGHEAPNLPVVISAQAQLTVGPLGSRLIPL